MSIHKYPLKGGFGYRAIVQISPTKQVSKKFKRKVDAETWAAAQRTLKATATDPVHLGPALTVKAFADQWLESHAKLRLERSSFERYVSCLRLQILPAFGHLKLTDVRPQAVEQWLLKLRDQDGLSSKTCNGCLGLLRKILNDAVRWGHLVGNPLHGVARLRFQEREMEFWSKDEAVSFLDWVTRVDPILYPAFGLALNTGMRLGEIAGLRWDCVDIERRLITVRRAWCQHENRVKEVTKTKSVRLIPINADLLDILIALRGQDHDGFVLPRCDFKNLHRRIRSLAKGAGVKPIRFHDLRHTFASMWMMAGQSMFELQKILGHQSIQMTERYSHLAPDHLAGKTDFLSLAPKKSAEVLSIRDAPCRFLADDARDAVEVVDTEKESMVEETRHWSESFPPICTASTRKSA